MEKGTDKSILSSAEQRQKLVIGIISAILVAGVIYLFVAGDVMVFCTMVFVCVLIFLMFGAQRRELPPMTPEEADKKKRADRNIVYVIALIVIAGAVVSFVRSEMIFIWVALLISIAVFFLLRGSELKRRRG